VTDDTFGTGGEHAARGERRRGPPVGGRL